jgi:hypothetical protein
MLFVDDLSMPSPEKYGAQPPIELLRQWIDHGHWYDLQTKSRIDMLDMVRFILIDYSITNIYSNMICSMFSYLLVYFNLLAGVQIKLPLVLLDI